MDEVSKSDHVEHVVLAVMRSGRQHHQAGQQQGQGAAQRAAQLAVHQQAPEAWPLAPPTTLPQVIQVQQLPAKGSKKNYINSVEN